MQMKLDDIELIKREDTDGSVSEIRSISDDNIGDVRELERKARRILEEQMNRYYGAPKI